MQSCVEDEIVFDAGRISVITQLEPPPLQPSCTEVVNTPVRMAQWTQAGFPTMQEGGGIAKKRQQTLHLSAGSSPQQKADAMPAKMRARTA